jgi:assimilatory nitrate reductase catalytic subunit
MNTGRVRDQWHTMSRTGKAPTLGSHDPEPFVEIHSISAAARQLEHGALAEVSSPLGRVVVRTRITDTQSPGAIFLPMHWNDRYSAQARIGTLIPSITDPLSGQPEAKGAPAQVNAWQPDWHAFLLSRRPVEPLACDYWSVSRCKGHLRYELAGKATPASWAEQALLWLGVTGELVEFEDRSAGRYRCGLLVDGRLEACLFTGPDIHLPERDWLGELFSASRLDQAARTSLLTGKAPAGTRTQGRTVCACFGVGIETITDAIAEHKLMSVEQIGELLKAGTGCGSCVPELRQILAARV